MLQTKFPSLDEPISKISFGAASISGEGGGYGFGQISESEAIRLLHEAKENGIRIFDTAPIYGFGTSEERIGKAFSHQREDVFLVSKSGIDWHDNKRVNLTNDPVVTKRMLEESLKRLQTDSIDLYMIHWPDPNVDIRKPIEVLKTAQSEGKIKHIGLSNTNPKDFQKAQEIADIKVLQGEFNLFQRQAETELFPIIRKHNLGFMSWGTLEKGILTGRVNRDRNFDKDDARSWAPWWKQMDKESRFRAMDRILPLLKKEGYSGLELALGFNLSHEEIHTVLCGMRNSEQLHSLLKALHHLPPQNLLDECAKIAEEALNS